MTTPLPKLKGSFLELVVKDMAWFHMGDHLIPSILDDPMITPHPHPKVNEGESLRSSWAIGVCK